MAFPSTSLLDNFNRADSSPLDGSWDVPLDVLNDGLALIGNRAAIDAGGDFSFAFWNGSTPGADCEVWATLPAVPAIDGAFLLARINYNSDLSQYEGYALVVYQVDGSGQVNITDFYASGDGNGFGASMGSFNTGAALAGGDAFGLEIVGETLTAYYKPAAGSWTSLGSVTNSLYAAAGQIGAGVYNESEIGLDDFGGGSYAPETPPAAPTLLSATAASNTQINLAWTDNASNEDGFEIERSANGTDGWALIDTTSANVTSRTNTGLTAATTYYYRVRAFNAVGNSAYSNIASATTMAIPTAPTLLTATAMSASSIALAWTDNATNETGYKIERSLDGVTFAQIDVVAPSTVAYTDTDLSANTLYYYRVRAFNADGNSAYSNIASATTLARCAGGLAYFDVLFRTARLLENLTEGAATADGTPTTLVDSHLGTFAGGVDDDFNGGTVFWKTHKDSPVNSEAVGSVANASTFNGTLAILPATASSVVLTTPGGTVTDDGAGAFASGAVEATDEALNFTASEANGTASAQLAYLRPDAGTVVITQVGETPVSDTDDGAGNINVWIPVTQYTTLGTLAAVRTFTGYYPASELPITPGVVVLQTPAGDVTDDGAGAFASDDIVLTGEAIDWLVSQETPDTGGILLSLSGVRIGNITPGSLTITWDDGVNPAQANTDDGLGAIDIYANGTTYAGTIDYDTGAVSVPSMPFADAAWMVTNTADFLFDATYKAITGTINYTTGGITLIFSTAQTGTISVFNLISYPHFVPATINYTTGLISITGLTPGDASWLDGNLYFTVTYDHQLVTGTVNYTTGAIALYFDRLVTGSVTASYTQNAARVFLPVMMRSTDFASASGTVTFEQTPIFNLAPGRGDTYGVSTRRYPLYLMFQKLNEAISEIKAYLLDQTDIPVSTITNNEIALADNVRIFGIWNGHTAISPQDWRNVARYQHVNGKVRFYDTLVMDTLRIKYFADVPEVVSETDCLPQQIDATWLAYETAVKCVRWRLFQPGADEKSLTTQVNDLMARAAKARANLNLYQPVKTAMKLPVFPEL